MQLDLPFEHTVLGMLQAADGRIFVMIHKTINSPPRPVEYVTYQVDTARAFDGKRHCFYGHYGMESLAHARQSLIQRAGWAS